MSTSGYRSRFFTPLLLFCVMPVFFKPENIIFETICEWMSFFVPLFFFSSKLFVFSLFRFHLFKIGLVPINLFSSLSRWHILWGVITWTSFIQFYWRMHIFFITIFRCQFEIMCEGHPQFFFLVNVRNKKKTET